MSLPLVEPTYYAPVLGALILLCLGVVIRLLTRMSETLTHHGETVVVLHTILVGASGSHGLIDRVQSLHDWRNDLQARELAAVNAENAELRNRRTGEDDRRHVQ